MVSSRRIFNISLRDSWGNGVHSASLSALETSLNCALARIVMNFGDYLKNCSFSSEEFESLQTFMQLCSINLADFYITCDYYEIILVITHCHAANLQEYRIILPLTLEEYNRAQLFAVAETSKNETGGGDGVEVIKQEPFTSSTIRSGETIYGVHTLKMFRSKSKSPLLFRKILPDKAFTLLEESWNAYPFCKTVITNPNYMKENFFIIIETMHIADKGETENDITPETDPRSFISEKTGRGKLNKNWSTTNTQPVMCCYKVVKIHCKIAGLQAPLENLCQKQYPRLFSKFNRELFCWMDKWYDLTLEDIRKLEEETMEQLKQRIQENEKRGICCDENNH
ncbi:unnamed protein product [Dracunculus medinensis]|uniref:Phosphatidylinositol transfer protein n=1 Tax=Dracunculus medinensis TaxID=318479 RepID=A0A0N4U0X4_DRAME|nr:unnamed protein product [Dracunculus medinensis]